MTANELRISDGSSDVCSSDLLALFGRDAGIDRLILANPWVVDENDGLPPAAAIRARYAERLRDPQTWLRAAKGGVSIGKFISGLRKVSSNSSQNENGLADRIFAVLPPSARSEEHTSELQSLMRISYAVFCL